MYRPLLGGKAATPSTALQKIGTDVRLAGPVSTRSNFLDNGPSHYKKHRP
jgi:hypothetical protein